MSDEQEVASDERSDRIVRAIVEAASLHLEGDPFAAVDRLIDDTPCEADGFAMTCALANGIAAQVDGDGPVMAEVMRIPGIEADPDRVKASEEAVTLAAAFIAGAGNGDWAGVNAAWRSAGMAAQATAMVDLFQILMTTAEPSGSEVRS